MRARSAFAAFALAAGLAATARAGPLPRLGVASFTFVADTRTPAQEQPFHLVIDVRLNGHIDDLEGVVLPQLGTLEILGDEKHTIANGTGTEYRETIGVVSHRGGSIAIPPAYLDAIDARDGKPKRFLSNDLRIDVAGTATVLAPPATTAWLARMAWFVLGGLVVVGLAIAALRMRRPPEAFVPALPEAEPEAIATPVATRVDAIARAREVLGKGATRENALAARSALWHSVGASDGETLADVVRRPAAHDPALRAVLRAVERAAFTNDGDRSAAVGDALRALDGYRA